MRKHKLTVILAVMAGYGMLCSSGPTLPEGPGRWAIAEYGIMLAIPIGLFVMAFRAFNGWHKTFHNRIILEASEMRPGSGYEP